MPRRTAALLAILVLTAASCARTEPSVEPTGDPSPAPTATPTRTERARPPIELGGVPLASCRLRSIEAQCGSLAVPEDPDDPTGRRIELRVAVIPAETDTPEPDPVFMLAGGPGGAATEAMTWTATTFRGIHAVRDIVLVDQRGTGGSNALWLGAVPDVAGLSEAEADATLRTWAEARLAELDGDPRFYTTSVAMDDLDAVRSALGHDLINLVGVSYGATAAQYYVRQHGEHLRSVVLDGATLLDVPIFEVMAAASQQALDLLFERCAADDACAAAFPTLPADFDAAAAAVARGPIETTVVDPFSGTPVVIDPLLFANAVHGALLNADTAAALPLLIRAAADGRWDDVAGAILAASGGRPPESGYPVMSAVIRCSERWADFDPEDVVRRGAGSYYLDVQVETARAQAAACRLAPPGIVPPNDAEPASSNVPLLFVVGEADPQDPPSNVADAPTHFPNSRTIVVPGHGHTVTHLGCMPAVVDAFIAAGSADGLDTSCVPEEMPIPPFRVQ